MYVFDLNNSMWCSQKNTLKLKVRLIYFYEISLYFLQQKKGSMIFYSWIMIFEKRKQQQWNCLTFLPIFCKRHGRYFWTDIACCQSKNHLLWQICNFIFVDRWSCFTSHFPNSNVITTNSFLDETEKKNPHGHIYYLFNDFSVFLLLCLKNLIKSYCNSDSNGSRLILFLL